MQKRPWEISDLLALRDGEDGDAGSSLDDAGARAQLARIHALQAALHDLPDVPVDEAVWNRPIPRKAQRGAWLRFPLATAASVFLASIVGIYLLFGGLHAAQQPTRYAGPGIAGPDFTGAARVDHGGLRLAALMSQSRDLERRLQGANPWTLSQANSHVATAPEPTVVSPTERRLMYRLADVDAQIARLYEAEAMDTHARHELWRQRVNLLESLVAVRGGSNSVFFEDSRSM